MVVALNSPPREGHSIKCFCWGGGGEDLIQPPPFYYLCRLLIWPCGHYEMATTHTKGPTKKWQGPWMHKCNSICPKIPKTKSEMLTLVSSPPHYPPPLYMSWPPCRQRPPPLYCPSPFRLPIASNRFLTSLHPHSLLFASNNLLLHEHLHQVKRRMTLIGVSRGKSCVEPPPPWPFPLPPLCGAHHILPFTLQTSFRVYCMLQNSFTLH